MRILAVLALAGYGVFLGRNTAVVAGGSDSSGYLNSARLLAAGKLLDELRVPAEFGPRESVDPMHFLPQGYFPFTNRTKLTPTYPTGLPLQFALAGKLLGWKLGGAAVMLLGALGSVALIYVLARDMGGSVALAVAGAVMLAAFPVFIFTSVQPLSDTNATCWTLLALVSGTRARRGNAWALATGGAFALAVLVRPTNILLLPALLVLLGLDWKRLALFAVAGLPAAVWLGCYNRALYGSPLQSGYGDVFSAFALSYGAPTAWHFAKWLALLLPAAVLVLPLFAWLRRDTRGRHLLALTLAFAAITGFYLFYEISHEVWWCLRFVLPAVPALIVAALLGAEGIARGPAKSRVLLALILGGWAAGNAAYWTPRLDVFMMKHYEQAYADGAAAAREQLPGNALVMSFAFSGSLYFYSDFPVLRWDQIEPPVFAGYVSRAKNAARPICAVIFDWEEKDAFRRCPGDWTRIGGIHNVGLWRLAGP